MSGKARTVLGDIEASAMGAVLPHEHLLDNADAYWEGQDDPLADPDPTSRPRLDNLWHWQEYGLANRGNLRLDSEESAIAELKTLHTWGIGTIVELTNIGIGRNVAGLRRISAASGIHVVAGTGYYVAGAQTDEVKALTEDQMVEQIVNDITVGVDGTDIRAGVIGEVGLSWPINSFEERSLAAGVRAQKLTGAALSIHTPYFLSDVDVLREIGQRIADLGADMSRVILGHCDSFARDPRFFEVMPKLGCYIEVDTFSNSGYEAAFDYTYPSVEDRIKAVIGLIKAGAADRVLISHDIAFKTHTQTHGGHGYGQISRVVVPWMKRLGVDESTVEQILVRNPQRVIPLIPVASTA